MTAATAPVPPAGERPRLRALASTRFTLAALVATGASVIAHAQVEGGLPGLLAATLALAAANLLAALVAQPRLRADLPMFVFHLALLALLVLAAIGRLTALTGTIELSQGEVFDGQLLTREAGPLHRDRLARLRFVNDGFAIDYSEGWRRGRTANQVRVFGPGGEVSALTIGDLDALVIDGYRFYTTANKGFAPVFRWISRANATMERGAVHLPSYPANEFRQAQRWHIPGTAREAWVLLELPGPAIDPTRASRFRLPESHHVVLVVEGVRRELNVGDSVNLDDGVLVYEDLRAWMGYKVFYDPTLPWMLVAALVGIGALAAYYWRRFGRLGAGGDG